jgi:D-glycero-D-manno-heptose 1,7-bisphosphate phosphatase
MLKNKALFLDRDGVINIDYPYVHSREEFHFQKGIFELCRAAQSLNYLLLVVTNQSGIARGYFTEVDFLELTEWMLDRFAEQQIYIARVYFCPFHPVYGVGRYKSDTPFRKPHPGMLFRARTDFSLDLAASVLIGDKQLDMEAAQAAGIGTKILFRSGTENIEAQEDHSYVSNSLDDIRHRFFALNI